MEALWEDIRACSWVLLVLGTAQSPSKTELAFCFQGYGLGCKTAAVSLIGSQANRES